MRKIPQLRNLLVLSLLVLYPSLSLALQLVYPEDGTSIRKSNYLIIMAGKNPPVEGLTVAINGVDSDIIDISSTEYRQAFGDKLILMPEFDPGPNALVVKSYTQGKLVDRVEAEIFYAVNPWDDTPEQYPPFVMHLPENEALCAPCHNMDPSPEEFNNYDPRRNPCNSCHKRMIHRKHVHGPAGVLECATCHDATSRPAKYGIEGSGNSLCLECHDDKYQEFNEQKYIHGPVETGDCLVCHDPHAAEEYSQVRTRINTLCQACHEAFGDGSHVLRGVGGKIHPVAGKNDPLRMGRELICTSCHDPHAGKAKAYFIADMTSRMGLCQHCHQK
ncbi:MAG: cytochrome C [Desulfuromonadales bacterium]|nr:cytochrome C [Desulfuromonadales bacterium]